jgi:formate dehydrogenase iron-sulfur subunit
LSELQERAAARVLQLQERGQKKARLYGADEQILGGLSSFYLLVDEPEVYGLPSSPKEPPQTVVGSSWRAIVAAISITIGAFWAFRKEGPEEGDQP